jgi:hypothetical protein
MQDFSPPRLHHSRGFNLPLLNKVLTSTSTLPNVFFFFSFTRDVLKNLEDKKAAQTNSKSKSQKLNLVKMGKGQKRSICLI